MILYVIKFHNLTDFVQTKREGPKRQMIPFPWLMNSFLLMPYQPPLKVYSASTLLIGIYVTSPMSIAISTITATAGRPAVVEFNRRAPHLCFVCIIKEARSKLMERYKPKLLRRKQGTMSNLRWLLVSVPPQKLDIIKAYHCHLHLSLSLPQGTTLLELVSLKEV